jgi:hypothetical protein
MRERSVVLRVSRSLEVKEPLNLFFAYVWTRTRVYDVSVEYVSCVRCHLETIRLEPIRRIKP